MARPIRTAKPYSKKERDYISRVAGKVPVAVIAAQLNRTKESVMQWACTHGIKLRVSQEILKKHWKEYAYARNKTAMQE